jgi:hypothetical protein
VTDIYFRHAKYTADIYVDPLKMTLIGGEHIAGTIIQGGEEEGAPYLGMVDLLRELGLSRQPRVDGTAIRTS